MEKQAFFQDFQQKVMDLIKASPAADIERNVKALMGQTFNKLELVSREEFDIQAALLQSLQARVDALEARLAQQADKRDGGQPNA
ncbi:accessory factor UbiK family protein [Lautropia mirabilis]|uniref:accessory factor UbiK family protein n=1 Tax=Lautropia mirabilis TaxID=47671 RepID=UPI0028F0B8B1|nr:accessory factor UbiK family protein [Lautropia mirabilis]